MPYCPVPKDLSKVKTKVAFNLTKRQLICFSCAAAVGVPAYIITRGIIGSEGGVLLMIGLMIPFFFMAMYEKDGLPAEKIIRNYVRTRLFFPGKRPYKTENLYAILETEKEDETVANENKTSKAAGNPVKRRKKRSAKRKK